MGTWLHSISYMHSDNFIGVAYCSEHLARFYGDLYTKKCNHDSTKDLTNYKENNSFEKLQSFLIHKISAPVLRKVRISSRNSDK